MVGTRKRGYCIPPSTFNSHSYSYHHCSGYSHHLPFLGWTSKVTVFFGESTCGNSTHYYSRRPRSASCRMMISSRYSFLRIRDLPSSPGNDAVPRTMFFTQCLRFRSPYLWVTRKLWPALCVFPHILDRDGWWVRVTAAGPLRSLPRVEGCATGITGSAGYKGGKTVCTY
jgi:hypothetical protein